MITREQIGPRFPSGWEGQEQAWTLDCLVSRSLSCPQLAGGIFTLCQFNSPELLLCEGPLLRIGDIMVTKRDKCLFTRGAGILVGETVKSQSKRMKCAAVWMMASAGDTIKYGEGRECGEREAARAGWFREGFEEVTPELRPE